MRQPRQRAPHDGPQCAQCGYRGDAAALYSWMYEGEPRYLCFNVAACAARQADPRRALTGQRARIVVALCAAGVLAAGAAQAIQDMRGPAVPGLILAVAGPLLLAGGLAAALTWWVQALKSGSSAR